MKRVHEVDMWLKATNVLRSFATNVGYVRSMSVTDTHYVRVFTCNPLSDVRKLGRHATVGTDSRPGKCKYGTRKYSSRRMKKKTTANLGHLMRKKVKPDLY